MANLDALCQDAELGLYTTIQTVGEGPLKRRKTRPICQPATQQSDFSFFSHFLLPICISYNIRDTVERRPFQTPPATLARLCGSRAHPAPPPALRAYGPGLLLPAPPQMRQTQVPLCHRPAARQLCPDPK